MLQTQGWLATPDSCCGRGLSRAGRRSGQSRRRICCWTRRPGRARAVAGIPSDADSDPRRCAGRLPRMREPGVSQGKLATPRGRCEEALRGDMGQVRKDEGGGDDPRPALEGRAGGRDGNSEARRVWAAGRAGAVLTTRDRAALGPSPCGIPGRLQKRLRNNAGCAQRERGRVGTCTCAWNLLFSYV